MPKGTDAQAIEGVVGRFVEHVRGMIRVDAAYLFGSRAKGRAQPYSDIDVAIVSPDFSGVRFDDAVRLIPAVLDTDVSVEVHPYRPEDFSPDRDPFVAEILSSGVRVV